MKLVYHLDFNESHASECLLVDVGSWEICRWKAPLNADGRLFPQRLHLQEALDLMAGAIWKWMFDDV